MGIEALVVGGLEASFDGIQRINEEIYSESSACTCLGEDVSEGIEASDTLATRRMSVLVLLKDMKQRKEAATRGNACHSSIIVVVVVITAEISSFRIVPGGTRKCEPRPLEPLFSPFIALADYD